MRPDVEDTRTSKHRNNAEEDLLDGLHRAPALGRGLVHRRVVPGRVQDRDADRAVWVDCASRWTRVECTGRLS